MRDDFYERCLPLEGLSPQDLGPCWQGTQKVAWLVGHHKDGVASGGVTSDPAAGNAYAFAVLTPSDRPGGVCSWSFRASDYEVTSEKRSGRVVWVPPKSGLYTIQVRVFEGEVEIDAITATFPIRDPEPDVVALRGVRDPRIVPLGNPEAFSRVYADLMTSVVSDVYATLDPSCQALIDFALAPVYSYTALSQSAGSGDASQCESLLARRPKRGKLVHPPPLAPPSALSGCEPEGVFGMTLFTAALFERLYVELDPEYALRFVRADRREGWLLKRFSLLSDRTKIALVNRLRFPRSAARIFADAIAYCIRTWRDCHIAVAPLAFPDPDMLEHSERTAIVASLIHGGGAYLVREYSTPLELNATGFGEAYRTNVLSPVFTGLMFPSSEDQAIKARWMSAWEISDATLEAGWPQSVKELIARRQATPSGGEPRWGRVTPLPRSSFTGGYVNYRSLEKQYREFMRVHWDLFGYHDIKDSPIECLRRNLVCVAGLFGFSKTIVHWYFLEKLAAVEDALPSEVWPKAIDSFNPRATYGGGFSRHASGLAVDLDPASNGDLYAKDLTVVADMAKLMGKTINWDDRSIPMARAAHQAFRDAVQEIKRHKKQGGQAEDNPLAKLERSSNVVRYLVGKYGANGFFTLDDRVIELMVQQGVGWGGDYKSFRDYMHFEYPVVEKHPDPSPSP